MVNVLNLYITNGAGQVRRRAREKDKLSRCNDKE
jgi:hypothetical protein